MYYLFLQEKKEKKHNSGGSETHKVRDMVHNPAGAQKEDSAEQTAVWSYCVLVE